VFKILTLDPVFQIKFEVAYLSEQQQEDKDDEQKVQV
jgi:hypothetical protein